MISNKKHFCCHQDQQSKIDVVNKWIKEHKKFGSIDSEKDPSDEKDAEENEPNTTVIEDDETEKSIEVEDSENIDHYKYLKKRKSSRNLTRNRKTRKIRDYEAIHSQPITTLKTLNIYETFERDTDKDAAIRNKLVYKEYRRHKYFLLAFF